MSDTQTLIEQITAPLLEAGQQVPDALAQIIQRQEQSVSELTAALASGEIDQETYENELIREKTVLETELLTERIRVNAALQKAIDSAFDQLAKLVSAAI